MSFPYGSITPQTGWTYNVSTDTLSFTIADTYTLSPLFDINVNYIVVGGGGGGSYSNSGGGGGETRFGTISAIGSTSYTIVVGSGGTGGTMNSTNEYGTNGLNSSLDTITAQGGYAGDFYIGGAGGGSFGNGGIGNNNTSIPGGVNGGNGTLSAANGSFGGGAGGSGGSPANPGGASGGNGFNNIYGGGGGGGDYGGGPGGQGGGGRGAGGGITYGMANTGGGGGGGGGNNTSNGDFDGGSGVVILSNFTTNPSCFNKGTKILCLNKNFEEEYIPIENLIKGYLVKTYKHGYKKIDLIGKNNMINKPDVWHSCMYKMVKTQKNGLLDDLIVTGGHAILVSCLEEYKQENEVKFGGQTPIIDDKYLLLSAVSKEFIKLENNNVYIYYHFTLENNGNDDKRFGVWANGVLTETPSKKQFINHKYTLL